MVKVFVTGAGGGVGQGVIKSLKLIQDYDVEIISADMSPLAVGLYWADKHYLVPKASHEDYIPYLINLFIKEEVDFYIPGTDVELFVSAQNAEKIKQSTGTEVIVCPESGITIADDKYKTYEFLSKQGLAAPKTYLPDEVELNSLEFPVIVKPRVGCRSIDVVKMDNSSDLQQWLSWHEDCVIQEYLAEDEEEYTCTIVVVDNKTSEVAILKRELRAGDTYRAIPIENQRISDYVTQAALALGVQGSCNFQLRLDKGIPKIFEINARFSGTTPFCAQLGFNPVAYYLNHRLGMSYQGRIDYSKMVLRYWAEYLVEKEQCLMRSKPEAFS